MMLVILILILVLIRILILVLILMLIAFWSLRGRRRAPEADAVGVQILHEALLFSSSCYFLSFHCHFLLSHRYIIFLALLLL